MRRNERRARISETERPIFGSLQVGQERQTIRNSSVCVGDDRIRPWALGGQEWQVV
jgi:hypothetical protein